LINKEKILKIIKIKLDKDKIICNNDYISETNIIQRKKKMKNLLLNILGLIK